MTAIHLAASSHSHFTALLARIILHSKHCICTCPVPLEQCKCFKLILWCVQIHCSRKVLIGKINTSIIWFHCMKKKSKFSTYSSVTSMLTQLNWQSLEERRTNAIIIMFYKVINNLISINFSHDLQPVMSSTRGFLKRFISLPARINSYYYSFLPHSIRLWNSLPANLVMESDLNSFCNALHNFRTQ